MKLFPALVATLLQEAKSQTCDGNPVFAVTCHEDLVVELAGNVTHQGYVGAGIHGIIQSNSIFRLVNKPCLTEKFPFVSLTELQINPTDAAGNVPEDANGNSLQCLPCTNPPCSQSANFMAYDFSVANTTVVAVDDNSASLFFKAGQCGTSMTISTDKTKAIFKTDIGKPAEVDANTGIVTETTLLETDITCEYPSTISGIEMHPGMEVIADASQDSDK